MDGAVARVLAQVPFTPADLPGYAGQLFDFLVANPHQLRLATWHRLERVGTGRETAELTDSHQANTAAVSRARAGRRPSSSCAPEDLYVFTLAIASACTTRGFGRELAVAALEHGNNVVAAARRPEQLGDLARWGAHVRRAALDVTDPAAAHAAVQGAAEEFGSLDVVVNTSATPSARPSRR